MAYYLSVRNGKRHDIIDITKAKCFTRLSNFKKKGACTLQEIDIFTTMFSNLEELSTYLYNEGLIDKYYNDISIRSLKQDKLDKVMYDLLYQKNIEYLVPSILKQEILNRSYDYDFLEAFVKRFYNYYDCRVSINELGCYVSDSLRGNRNRYLFERLNEVTNLLIYDYDNNSKYKNVHTIAAFIANYDKKKNQEKDISVKPKLRTKKKEIKGQISMFGE